MAPASRHLLLLLSAELQDIIEDIHALEASLENRFKKSEITKYVFMENESVLHHEVSGLTIIHQKLSNLNPEQANDLESMAGLLKEFVKTIVNDQDLPQGLIPLLERKIDKLKGYCEAD